jgi:hypothetical protein
MKNTIVRFIQFVIPFLLIVGVVPSVNAAESGKDWSGTQWGLAAVRSYEAWSVTKGKGVVVAVLDTGVDGTHPDLAGRVLAGYSTIREIELEAGENSDEDSHGTHVSGIIAGDDDKDGIVGVAPEASILPVQVLGYSGGSDLTVANGIDWAVANGARVLNLSLGGERNPFDKGGSLSCQAVSRAYDAGVVVIVAAGNSGGDGNPRNEPASCRGALSVGALDEELERTFFSSFDETIGISAPGRRIVSSVPVFSDFSFDSWNGTSMAAPFVSGVAALIIANNPSLKAGEVFDILRNSAVDLGVLGSDPETGAGLVDAAAAVGLGKVSKSETLINLRKYVTPLVVSSESNGESTFVKWEAPVGVAVDKYIIRYINQGSVIESEVFNSFEGFIDADAWISGYIVVVAVVNGLERSSLPYLGTNLNFGDGVKVELPKMVSAKGTWVNDGLLVEFATSGVDGEIDVTLLDWNFGLVYDGDVKSTEKKVLIPVELSSETRGHWAGLLVGVEGDRISIDVKPQFSISAKVFTAGKNFVVVKGSTAVACMFDNVGCKGQTVNAVSTNGKILGKVKVLENLEFYITLPRKNLSSFVIATSGKFKSAKIEVPEYKEKK